MLRTSRWTSRRRTRDCLHIKSSDKHHTRATIPSLLLYSRMSSKSRENHNRLHDRDPGPVTLSNQGQDRSYLEPDFNENDDQTTALMSQEATTEHNPEF